MTYQTETKDISEENVRERCTHDTDSGRYPDDRNDGVIDLDPSVSTP